MIDAGAFVHPKSEIHETAEIARNAYIGEGCVIGANVKVGYNAIVECHTTVGEGSEICPNAHIGGAPQDVSYKGEDTKLIIGKKCVVREFATINRASTKEDWKTEIGDNLYMMAYAHVGHDCKLGNGVVLVNAVQLAGHVHVGNFVNFAGLSGAHQFVRIGDMCMIGNRTSILKDMPPFCLAGEGHLVGLNMVGLKRRGVKPEARLELKKALKIYMNLHNKLADLPSLFDGLEQYEEIKMFKDFIKDSKRSFLRG